MNAIKYLVVHCSDTPETMYCDMPIIHKWHLERGFEGNGYNAGILRDGTLQLGRPEYWQGAHVAGHNHEALGVVLMGRTYYMESQYRRLGALLLFWKEEYPEAEVVGHGDLDPKKSFCPGFDVRSWWEAWIRKEAEGGG